MPDLAAGGLTRLELLALAVSGLCTAAVLLAVAVNFALRRDQPEVERRLTSPVATLSMLAFLAAFLLLLRLRLGVVPLPPGPLRQALVLLGLGLVVTGCAVNLLGRAALGGNWADPVTLYRDQTLVRHGVFALVRHPLYASLVWMFVGGSLLFRNLAALAATLLVFLPAMVYRARQEEVLLASRFPEYQAYRRRVGMLFPRLPGRPR